VHHEPEAVGYLEADRLMGQLHTRLHAGRKAIECLFA
jgi:hypothetical protein